MVVVGALALLMGPATWWRDFGQVVPGDPPPFVTICSTHYFPAGTAGQVPAAARPVGRTPAGATIWGDWTGYGDSGCPPNVLVAASSGKPPVIARYRHPNARP